MQTGMLDANGLKGLLLAGILTGVLGVVNYLSVEQVNLVEEAKKEFPKLKKMALVRKAVQMAQKMSVPIIGVVENMSYFILPDSGKKIELFGKSKGQEMAKSAGAPLLGQLPIDPELARLCDEGNIEHYESATLSGLADAFLKAMSAKKPANRKIRW